jgi:hypothetical protein
MKIALWTAVAAVALALTACSHSNNNTASTTTGMSTGSGTGSSAPTAAAPTDFVSFVYQQIASEPAFGSAPAATTALTTDLELGNAEAFAGTTFGSGDALPPGTFQASVACAQAGPACNPTVSADLNSTLN